MPVLVIGAELPGQGAEAGNHAEEDECVGLPVRGLRVPATGWGPDVLRVPDCAKAVALAVVSEGATRYVWLGGQACSIR